MSRSIPHSPPTPPVADSYRVQGLFADPKTVMGATIFLNVISLSMLSILAPQLTTTLVDGDDARSSQVFGNMLSIQALLNMLR